MGASRKRTGSQKKATKSKAAQSAADRRRAQRKATGQAAQKAGKYKSIKPSAAATRARSRASERRKKSRQQAAAQAAAAAKIRAAEKAAASRTTASTSSGPDKFGVTRRRVSTVSPGTPRTVSGGRGNVVERPGARAVSRGSGRGSSRSAPTPYQTRQRVAANQAAAARSSRSGMQTGRGAAGQTSVTGGRGRTVERPGERAAAIARQRAAQMRRVRPQPKPTGMSISRAKAGLYNLLPEFLRTDNKSGRTAKQQAFHDSIHGADARRKRRRRRKDSGGDQVVPPRPKEEVDDFRDRRPPDLPPEIVDEFPPVMPPRFPQYPGMGGGIGAFGYNPALMAFESQQGAGQVPYYMAAARNAMTPNMSPAFMHAARNYDILGGMQRTAPRPMEMMSAAERAQIAGMSNFSTPNYNSPYDQFNFFSNMVGSGGMPTQAPTSPFGKGAKSGGGGVGLGALLASGMFG